LQKNEEEGEEGVHLKFVIASFLNAFASTDDDDAIMLVIAIGLVACRFLA
jgi:hypothetical protein